MAAMLTRKTAILKTILALSVLPSSVYSQDFSDENEDTQARTYDRKTIEDDYTSVPVYKDRQITFTTGYDYSSGKFNLPANTNISYIPYSLQYETGKWEFKINSGYISFAAPKNVVPVIEGAPLVTDVDLTPTDRYRNPRKDGFGDVYLSAKYSIENPYSNDLYIDLTGRIKIPTANEYKGLGTGKVDYIVKADFAYLMGNFMPFATLGYRFIGKTHLYDLQNSFFASVGASYYLTYDTSIGVSYEYRESATPGFNSPKEIFAYTDVQINDHWGVNFYGVVGLNNVTTDYGLGTQLRYKF